MTALAAGVAAGHPATAAAGLRILEQGGSAADAAVAATFASCVAETVMTGLGGGGHAIHWNAARGEAHLIDFFVNVPGCGARGGADLGRGERHPVNVAFGSQIIPYDIGMGTVAVPGVAQGCGELHDRWGRLEWEALLAPARELAVEGVPMPPKHALTMNMIIESLARDHGARIYTPGGAPLATGDMLRQPGLATAFDLLASEGPQTFAKGTIAERMLEMSAERGGLLTQRDLEDYEVRVTLAGRGVRFGPYRVTARRDMAGFLDALARLPHGHAATPRRWAPAFADVFSGQDHMGDTTNLVTADPQGNACVVTSSLGLGSGHYLPELDLHLNSMLGETELLTTQSRPGTRMQSMMVPSLAIDDRGDVAAAAGAAGGSRIRTALAHVLTTALLDGVDPGVAARSPRLHPVGRVAHTEPGYPQEGITGLADAGYDVHQWPDVHHFFGGASLLTRTGGGGDPRRDGVALLLG
jgi:gamma-glutamyltranspeptidase/glutathione hydrolase